jgi:NAD(P)H-hydrate epimerase
MLRALTAEQAQAMESRAVSVAGVSLMQLMRNAGEVVAREAAERVPEGRIVVLAGPGNNGGDGWIAARTLHASGREVQVLGLRPPEQLSGEAAKAADEAVRAGVEWDAPADASIAGRLSEATVVIDALLGTGAKPPLRDPVSAWCAAANESGAYIVSVDVPTGVDSDGGWFSADAVEADLTVTFTAPKRGVVVYPSAAYAGEVLVADIGIPPEFADVDGAPEVWTERDYAALLPRPSIDAHKNERGRVLVVAGSGHFPGAAVLAARGAMRAGAGYVTLAVPDPVVQTAQSHLLAAPVVGLPSARTRALSSNAAAVILELSADYDAVVLGPGLTLADGAVATVRSVFAALNKPLVLDADGLNALIDAGDLLERRRAPVVLTPHPGELGRLLGVSASVVQGDRVFSSARLAGFNRAVVLKGAGTVVSGSNRQVIITAGTPALATAGTGDVLAGVIGTLLAQGLAPLEAGALGAHLHARAGEEAAARLTPLCVTAEDVPEHLPYAVASLLDTW